MTVAMAAMVFFAFAAFSGLLSIGIGFVAFRFLHRGTARPYGAYVFGSGCLGAIAAMLFGVVIRWNVFGDAVLKQPLLGYPAWALIGFGWSALAALLVGAVVRKLVLRGAES